MNNGRKISLKYIPALIFTVQFFCITLNSSAIHGHSYRGFSNFPDSAKGTPAFSITDTVPLKLSPSKKKDSLPVAIADSSREDTIRFDTTEVIVDTTHIPISKDSLDAPVAYSAQDSVVLDVPTKIITLYNKANTKYKDITLDAYKIQMDQPKQLMVATFTRDTANKIIGKPKMVQAESNMESDSIVYSMKTQKGITINTFTQSGEMFVLGEKMKKISKTEFYAYRGRFTTCDLDTPHFAFRTNKMKLINKKFAISGPVHPEFEGVPIPIYIPFGFFPISQGRHSGLLPPTFNVSSQYGLGLTGLGYYKVLSDNFDVAARTDLYSYGGYTFYLTPEYRVRYRYSGRLNFTYQKTRTLSNSGNQNFDDTKTWSLGWSHTVDSKARPGQTFSANLNLMSTKFNQFVLNNPTANFTNQISSSIAYSKTWNGKYNLTVSGNHSQNNQTRLITVNLPTIGFTAITIYPFQDKDFVGTPKWYQKLGIGLTTNISGSSSFYDSTVTFKHAIDTFTWGAQHNIPISLALPPLGPLQVSPGLSLQDRWYTRLSSYRWDEKLRKVDTTVEKGFFTANAVSLSLNFTTAVFGTFTGFGKNSDILGIRHTLRPTIGISYTPDLNKGTYQNIQVDTNGNYQNLSRYAGNVYGPFSPGTFGGINFGLDNNIELKLRSKTDTTTGANTKMKLIDGFGFTGSYNYLADSFKLSPINFYLRSTLFQKVNITGGVNLNPYITDSLGYQKNIYAWQQGKFSLGRITSGSLSISTSFKSKPKDKKKEEDEKKEQDDQVPMTPEEQQSQMEYIRNNPAQFADFNIAWSVNISYSLNFTRQLKPDYSGYATNLQSSLILSSDFNLTEKWKVGFNTYYDVKALKVQSFTGFLSRDLHCWQMSINVTPVGLFRSFSITLNPKSSILRDLKINRNRTFD
jgi:LPS-assembly protein